MRRHAKQREVTGQAESGGVRRSQAESGGVRRSQASGKVWDNAKMCHIGTGWTGWQDMTRWQDRAWPELSLDLCLVEFKRGDDSMIPCMVKHKAAATGGIPEISRESEDFQLEISRIIRISSKIWLCHVHVKHEASGSGHSVKQDMPTSQDIPGHTRTSAKRTTTSRNYLELLGTGQSWDTQQFLLFSSHTLHENRILLQGGASNLHFTLAGCQENDKHDKHDKQQVLDMLNMLNVLKSSVSNCKNTTSQRWREDAKGCQHDLYGSLINLKIDMFPSAGQGCSAF